MALIKCFECGKEVSNTTKQCPHCGYTIAERIETERKKVEAGERNRKKNIEKKQLEIFFIFGLPIIIIFFYILYYRNFYYTIPYIILTITIIKIVKILKSKNRKNILKNKKILTFGITMPVLFFLTLILAVRNYNLPENVEYRKQQVEKIKIEAEAEKEKVKMKAEAEKAKRKAGFHCLSGWDGSHNELQAYVKQRIIDRKSFEHKETLITPVSPKKTHEINMQYVARNGFGGLVLGEARATISHKTCEIIKVYHLE